MIEPTDDLIRDVYRAYSTQDLARLLAFLADDVDWPDGRRRMHGRDEVRRYWAEQWGRVRTVDVPAVIASLSDSVRVVRVEQTVRDLAERVVSRATFVHVLSFSGCLLARLDIVRL